MNDATHLPCGHCGAPLDVPTLSPSATDEVRVACAWCGTEETLPGEAAERVRALQIRRAQRAWADAATNGPAVAFATFADARGTLKIAAPMALVMGFSLASNLAFGAHIAHIAPLVSASLGLGIAALWVSRRARKVLAPLLVARPSAHPSAPARCRRCGAPITFTGGTSRCGSCQATNLAPDAVARRLADAGDLGERHREAGRRRQQLERLSTDIGAAFTVGLFGGFVIGYIVAGALS